MSVWIVVPTYNEAENIRELVSSILKALSETSVIVVDDNSPDGTAEIVGEMSKADNRIHLLRRPEKRILGMTAKPMNRTGAKDIGKIWAHRERLPS
jgi:dolichol-phosphate mannosyltransferase